MRKVLAVGLLCGLAIFLAITYVPEAKSTKRPKSPPAATSSQPLAAPYSQEEEKEFVARYLAPMTNEFFAGRFPIPEINDRFRNRMAIVTARYPERTLEFDAGYGGDRSNGVASKIGRAHV